MILVSPLDIPLPYFLKRRVNAVAGVHAHCDEKPDGGGSGLFSEPNGSKEDGDDDFYGVISLFNRIQPARPAVARHSGSIANNHDRRY